MIQDDQQIGHQSSYTTLLNSIESIESNPKIASIFSNFIKEQPSKQQIVSICQAINKRKKQQQRFHEITDYLVMVIKLLVDSTKKSISLQEQEQIFNKFSAKLQVLSQKLKNNKVIEWITIIKDKLCKYKFLKQQNIKIVISQSKDMSFHQNSINKIARKLFSNQQLLEIKKEDIVQDIIRKISLLKDKRNQQMVDIHFTSKIEELTNKIAEKDKTILLLQKRIQEIQKKYHQKLFQKQQIYINQQNKNHLFTLDSLIINKNDFQSINFLGKIIQDIIPIQKNTTFKLLFTSNNQQKQSVHSAIDNKENILLIIKLKNGKIVGGFTTEEFRPKCYGQKGFLFSLTLKECYKRQKRSTISYNERYIIFGCNQLSIKQKQMILFSNFGSQPNHFTTLNRTISQFLGNGQKKSAQIQVYEFYQILTQ